MLRALVESITRSLVRSTHSTGEVSMKRSINGSLMAVAAMAAAVWLGAATPRASAQFGGFFQRSVGGVAINPDGVLEAPTLEDQQQLEQARQQARTNVPA